VKPYTTIKKNKIPARQFLFIAVTLTLVGCNAFMHGYTWSKAQNSFSLVSGDKENFGDKRLKYNKGFHRNSVLSDFLDCNCNNRGLPDFIYEYKSDTKCRGIKLFYVKPDSVFIFEEPKKNNLNSVLKEARKMDESEKQTYQRLKTGK
jgi:hypothetical protein